jgi:lipoprotein-anchoring transpeptidase ErfK/SrfK
VLKRLLVIVAVVAVTAPVLGGAAARPVLVPKGVTLAGVPIGGMSFEQAEAAVAPVYRRPLRLVFGDRTWPVRASRFGLSVPLADGVSRAVDASPGDAVDLKPTVDGAAVKAYVASLDKRFSYPAKDAELIGISNLVPQFSDPTTGLRVVDGATAKRIVRALESPDRPRVRLSVRAVAPKVTTASFGPVIVIRRSSNELRYYEGSTLVRSFGVATGQAIYPTPLGTWHIADMQLNPWWRPPDSSWAKGLKPIPPGPGNPLGTRWMGLDAAGVGIHGTPDDASIGYSASHGCIRMHIPDAEWLFQHVHVGTPVIITDA